MDEGKFLQFELGIESYAVPLLKVKEVIPVPETTALPNSPGHYVGIMNLRGQIISIVDLRKKLGIKNIQQEEDIEEAVIIVEYEGVAVGVVVDSITRVIGADMNEVMEVPEVKAHINAKFIQCVYKSKEDDKLVLFVDLAKILNLSELNNLKRSA